MHGQGRNVLTYFLIVGERNTEIAVCATAELSASPHFPPPTPGFAIFPLPFRVKYEYW